MGKNSFLHYIDNMFDDWNEDLCLVNIHATSQEEHFSLKRINQAYAGKQTKTQDWKQVAAFPNMKSPKNRRIC